MKKKLTLHRETVRRLTGAMKAVILAVLCAACVADATGDVRQDVRCELDQCPIDDEGGGGTPPLAINPTPAEYDAIVADWFRENQPTCEWDRCGDKGGYLCQTPGATCLLTRQGRLFCTVDVRRCFRTDAVCSAYQCPNWRWDP